jgi:hypothetical protein
MKILHNKKKKNHKIEWFKCENIVFDKEAIFQRLNGNLKYVNGFFINNMGAMITIVHVPSVKKGENKLSIRLHNKKKTEAIISNIIDEANDVAFGKAINYGGSFLNFNIEANHHVNSKVKVITLNKKLEWIFCKGTVIEFNEFGILEVFTARFETWPICIGSPVFDIYGNCCGIVRANSNSLKTVWCISYPSIYKKIADVNEQSVI